MEWNAEKIRLALDIFNFVEMIVIAVYVWIVTKHKANKDAIDKVNLRVDSLSERLLRVESDIQHMPSHVELSKIHEKINTVSDGLSTLEGEFKAFNATLNLIHQFLLERGK